jgi:CRISPR-associated protein Csm4
MGGTELQLYEITIRPRGGLGTPLKGDTLFGHFCWQVAYDASLLEGGLEKQLALYGENPFVIFSSAFPKLKHDGAYYYALKRPDLPLAYFPLPPGKNKVQAMKARKEQKQKRWWMIPADLRLDYTSALLVSDQELLTWTAWQHDPVLRRAGGQAAQPRYTSELAQPHNTINRLTGTTGEGMFAPYTQEIVHFYPESELAIFVLVSKSASDIQRVVLALERIGQWGFGKDASIGQGRFQVAGSQKLSWPRNDQANAAYTLAPAVPEKQRYIRQCSLPFVRFGKHGDRYARSGQPFKNPVLLADEGAVFWPQERSFFDKPYLGMAVASLSKTCPAAVMQGYAPYLPCTLEI